MKGLVGIAVVLGVVGTVLGVMSLTGGSDAFEEQTMDGALPPPTAHPVQPERPEPPAPRIVVTEK